MKTLRRIIQWLFFLLFFAGFLSFLPDRGSGLFALLPKMQFFPAMVRYPLIAAAIVAVTFTFGRVYCSTLCPAATVQDFFIRRKQRFTYRKLSMATRYLVPTISLIVFFAGFPALASVLDPYSMSGRIVSSINELLILPLVDLIGLILRQFSIYITTYPIQFRWITIVISTAAVAVLYTMSRIGGRLYCNTLCPVGALLSIPARWAVFAHRIDAERCTTCGACEQVCKAEAIDLESKFIDPSKCVSCFNCTSVCRFNALSYRRKLKGDSASSKSNREQKGRRSFIRKTISATTVLLGLPAILRAKEAAGPSGIASRAAVPPGSGSRDSFLSKCTSCSLCISRCPGNVLQPAAFSQYGMKGFGVPFMDFNRGSCEFDCNLCSRLCPSGAIRLLDLDQKKRVRIGEARFVRNKCVVETDGTSCGACGEICPTGAIEMLHIGDSPDGALEIPLINSQFCIGCGACQFVCPVTAKDAIFVEALTPHGTAEIREVKSDSEPAEIDNDFAF